MHCEEESTSVVCVEGARRTIDVRCDFKDLIVVSGTMEVLKYSLLDDRASVDVDDRFHEELLAQKVEECLSEPRRSRGKRRTRELSLEEGDSDLLVCGRRTSQNSRRAASQRWGSTHRARRDRDA